MLSVLIVLIVVISICLGLVVLVQNSKGGGLASNFASSNQIMGVKKTTDFIEKTTWVLAVAIMVLCLTASFISKSEYNKINKTSVDTEETMPADNESTSEE